MTHIHVYRLPPPHAMERGDPDRCDCGEERHEHVTAPALRMSEDQMLIGIMETAALNGWMLHHVRRADLGIAVGDTGYPDVTLTHPVRQKLLVLELKSGTGRYEPGQREWLAAFRSAGVDARTVTPPEYDDLIRELAGDQLLKMSGGRKP